MRWFVSLVIVLILTACSGPATINSNTVTLALDVPPTNLDPRIGIDVTSERVGQLLFSSLLRRGEQANIEPDLAESWEIPDPLTYVFHLRSDAQFHDGRPVTAKDVLYTFRTLMDGSIKTTKAGTYRLIESIRAPNDHTVVFKLKEPFAPFMWNLTRGAIGIIPEGSPGDFGRNPIGSGPFKFVRYVQDAELVIERNESYYGTKPFIEQVRFKIIPEAIVRALELRKGSVDGQIYALPPDMVEVLRENPDLQVLSAKGTIYQYFAFNLQDPAFRDVRVRQAIAHSIDRDKIIKYVWRNQVRPANSVIPPNNWAFEPNLPNYSYDPARARELLKEAGYPNLSFTYRCSTDDTSRMLAAVLQQQLRIVGINMEIRSNEFATFFADVQKGNFQAYSLRWIGGNNDPDIFNAIFHSKMTPPNGSNRGKYFNPDVDRLIDIGRREPDTDKRREAYQEIQRIIARELPYVSLWYWDNVAVFNKRIQGVKLYPAGDYEFLTHITVQPDVALR